jgi:hypothetical protein
MELPTGVFVARRSTDEWEPDPDVGGLMHVMCDVPGVQAGFTIRHLSSTGDLDASSS